MDRLRRANALFLILLVLNLTFWPAWQHAAVADEPAITEDDVLSAHIYAFTTLFGEEWNAEKWTYELSEAVNGPGLYSGKNYLEQAVDLNSVNLSATERGIVNEKSVSIAGAVAIISTSQGQVHVFGMIGGVKDSSKKSKWTFLPTYFADPGDKLFQAALIDPEQGMVALDDGFRDDVPPMEVQAQGEDCIDQALALYDSTVANCNDRA